MFRDENERDCFRKHSLMVFIGSFIFVAPTFALPTSRSRLARFSLIKIYICLIRFLFLRHSMSNVQRFRFRSPPEVFHCWIARSKVPVNLFRLGMADYAVT